MEQRYDRDAAEQWFRRRGLPAVVKGRPRSLLVRVVPALAFAAVWQLLLITLDVVDGGTEAEFERRLDNDLFLVGYFGLLLSLVVAPALAAWLTTKWVRWAVLRHRGTTVASVAIAVYVLVLPIAWLLGPDEDPLPVTIPAHALVVLLLLGIAFLGGGSIVGWSARAAMRQARSLGELTSRALPLFLLFTLFGFFTAEIWQFAASVERKRMWWVVALFVVVAVLFMLTMLSEEVRRLTSLRNATVALDKLESTPFQPFARAVADTDRVPLSKLERANMVLVLVLTQAFQTLVFATLTFVFFVTFGKIALKDEVIKAYATSGPTPGTLFGIQIPVPNELLQVSLFIAAFSAVYFTSSTVTDEKYRVAFFDPLTDHLAVSLAARDVYRARLSETT
ncbi:hypothetical protein ACFWY9_12545 [Amycolatopsis sp. NPDC059027]|uniref:hypothetical protein n=1 Tax=unclassified Amycolatopsis TaxID=2618356 RepID=UPI0036725789